jgi:hypothetical protein
LKVFLKEVKLKYNRILIDINMKKGNKKGILIGTVIFIILNLAFFVIMLLFIYSSNNRDFVYEQTYAKQITLLIDNAKPEMVMLLDISELVEIAKENKKDVKEMIKLDKDENKVFVSLRGERGYSYKYFTKAEVDLKIDDNDENKLVVSLE